MHAIMHSPLLSTDDDIVPNSTASMSQDIGSRFFVTPPTPPTLSRTSPNLLLSYSSAALGGSRDPWATLTTADPVELLRSDFRPTQDDCELVDTKLQRDGRVADNKKILSGLEWHGSSAQGSCSTCNRAKATAGTATNSFAVAISAEPQRCY